MIEAAKADPAVTDKTVVSAKTRENRMKTSPITPVIDVGVTRFGNIDVA